MAQRQIVVRELSRPVLKYVLRDDRNEDDPSAPIDITGYVFKLIVKNDLELADARAHFDLAGAIVTAASGIFSFTLTHEHTSLPAGSYPAEIRWWYPPDAPTVECADVLAAAGAGNVDNGLHTYAYSYVSPYGESDLSPVSGGVTVADKTVDGKVDVSAIAVGPAGTTARKLYRTVAGGTGDFKLVATIADNSTTTYQDNTADGSLGAVHAALADTTVPPADAWSVDFTVEQAVDKTV